MATSSIQAFGGSAVGGTGLRPEDLLDLKAKTNNIVRATYNPISGADWAFRRLFFSLDGVTFATYDPLNGYEQTVDISGGELEVFECREPSWPDEADMYAAAEAGKAVVIRRQSVSGDTKVDWHLLRAVKHLGPPPVLYSMLFTKTDGHTVDTVLFSSNDGTTWSTSTDSFDIADQSNVAPRWRGADAGTYRKGTLVYRSDTLYRCLTNTPSSSWVAAEWEATDIATELGRLWRMDMNTKHLRTGSLANITLDGTEINQVKNVSGVDAPITLTRMDDAEGGTNWFSATDTITITRARLVAAGTGRLLTLRKLAGNIALKVYIPAAFASSGADVLLSRARIRIAEWGEWEDKKVVLDTSTAQDSDWGASYADAKPVQIELDGGMSTSFGYEDYNIDEDYVGESFDIYLDICTDADKLVNAAGTDLID
jgi:hypothetical protein